MFRPRQRKCCIVIQCKERHQLFGNLFIAVAFADQPVVVKTHIANAVGLVLDIIANGWQQALKRERRCLLAGQPNSFSM